jgi:polysaccharide chain length determinant protein (PEP-CTERM system associated)
MKADDQTFADYLQVLKLRARPAIYAAVAVLFGMTLLVLSWPAVYESSATLLIEHPDVPIEATGNSSIDGYVEQRLQRTRQRVMTADNVWSLIESHKLFLTGDQKNLSREEKIDLFNQSVIVTPQVTGVIDPRSMRSADLTYAFNVAFRHHDPDIARDVADSLAELFISANAAQAKDVFAKTIEFLRTEAERLQTDLRRREEALAEFRQKHAGGLPEYREGNFQRARDLEGDLARVDDDLRNARARRNLLETQLRDTPRDRATLDETGQPVIRGADRLAAAQQELVAARAKYSDDHPDVRRLRKEIASLSSDTSTSASAPPTNPAYEQLQSQIAAADVESRDLTARRYELSRALSQMQTAISDSPRYDKQHADLVRDYELIKTQYEQIRARQTAAEVAQKAEDSQAAETYVLINPALQPTSPIEPDRLSLIFLAIVLSVATGFATASLLNATDSTVRSSADVTALSAVPVLGYVPLMENAAAQRRRRIGDLAAVAGVLATVAFMVIAVA